MRDLKTDILQVLLSQNGVSITIILYFSITVSLCHDNDKNKIKESCAIIQLASLHKFDGSGRSAL